MEGKKMPLLMQIFASSILQSASNRNDIVSIAGIDINLLECLVWCNATTVKDIATAIKMVGVLCR